MRMNRSRCKQAAMTVLTGMLFFNSSSCLPKDYFFRFAAAGQSTLLDAFADNLFNSIIDSLFPNADDGEDNGTDTTTGT